MKKILIRYLIMTGRYFILIFSIIAVSTSLLSAKNGYGQEPDTRKVYLAIQADQKPLKEIFRDIEKETKFSFFYNANSFNVNERISLHVKHESLYNILRLLSDKTGLEFNQVNKHISVRVVRDEAERKNYFLTYISRRIKNVPSKISIDRPPLRMPSEIRVRGSVTDDKGVPLVGVTVRVKGSEKGAVTDARGRFSLTAPENAVLTFSYIGYQEKEVSVRGRDHVNVQLAVSSKGLNQVVVVGYGTQKRLDVTSAVSQVTGNELRQTPTANLQNALTGKLAGLFTMQQSGQPGSASAANLFVRGVSTFKGNTQPLVLVDNIPYDYDQLFLIDPNAVKSISILKDAAATAIYGVKGANGAILITTRRGQVGKPVIHLRTTWGIQTPVHVLEELGSYQVAKLTNEADALDGLPPMWTDEDLALFKSGADPYGHPNVNWYNALFKHQTLITNNNLSISGGTKKIRYFINLGYMFQNGLLRQIPYKGKDQVAEGKTQVPVNFFSKRYKFRSNLDVEATPTLNFKLDISGTRQAANQPKFASMFPSLFSYFDAPPWMMPIYNPNGSFGYANPYRATPNQGANPAAVYSLGGYTRSLNDFMIVHLSGDQKLDIITKGLSLKGTLAYSFENTATRTLTRYKSSIPVYWFNPVDSTYHSPSVGLYSIPPYSKVYNAHGTGTPKRSLNLQAALNYSRSFGQNNEHNVSGLVLFNQMSTYVAANPPDNFRGYTFRFTYNFRHKYLLALSGAYNGSSRFVTQKRYSLFPALSGGWNIAREPFFNKILPFIESFKIRGSYGWVGSDAIGGNQYIYEQVYNTNGNYSLGTFDNSFPAIVEGTQGNTDVTWQTERKADVGLDFSMFNGKLSGTIDYFNDYRYDILTKRQTIPQYFGVQQSNLPPVNIGKVANQGYEIELNYNAKIGQVGVNIKGNLSIAKNKILFEDEPPALYPWEEATGRSVGQFRQYTWLGFYENQKDIDTSAVPAGVVKPGYLKYKDLNGDGKIDKDDQAYTGLPDIPSTNVGLTLGFNYKGVTFSILLQSALHFDVYLGNGNAVPFKTNLQPIHLGRWTPETAATATFPALTTTFNGTYMNPDNKSTFWTTPGDYLRIRSMYLGYTLPKKWVNKVGLTSAMLFANGYDLFTWSKFLKRWQFDPEVARGSGGYVYPPNRIINFGLNVTFK